MYNCSKIFVTLFYIGYSKIFPGTLGSFFAFIFLYYFNYYFNKIYLYLFFLVIFFLSLYFINIYQNKNKKKDPSEIIIDEFLGVFLIFFFLDYYENLNIMIILVLGFIFFRFFDIVKPFPINLIDQNIKNSFGVIMDDIIAGIYSVLSLVLVNAFI